MAGDISALVLRTALVRLMTSDSKQLALKEKMGYDGAHASPDTAHNMSSHAEAEVIEIPIHNQGEECLQRCGRMSIHCVPGSLKKQHTNHNFSISKPK